MKDDQSFRPRQPPQMLTGPATTLTVLQVLRGRALSLSPSMISTTTSRVASAVRTMLARHTEQSRRYT